MTTPLKIGEINTCVSLNYVSNSRTGYVELLLLFEDYILGEMMIWRDPNKKQSNIGGTDSFGFVTREEEILCHKVLSDFYQKNKEKIQEEVKKLMIKENL